MNENYDETILKIEKLAYSLLKQDWIIDEILYNLQQLGWTFKFNNAKKALGTCKRLSKTIELSKYIIADNIDIDIWEDTLKHEIAHAIDIEQRDYSNHGPEWIHIAKQVGCDTSPVYKGKKLKSGDSKYIFKCDTCGDITPAYKKRKKISACRLCCNTYNNGKFTEKYALELLIND